MTSRAGYPGIPGRTVATLKRLVHGDPERDAALLEGVILEARVLVRQRQNAVGSTWRGWHRSLGGGPILRVRMHSIQLKAPQGTMIEPRHLVFPAKNLTMATGRMRNSPLLSGPMSDCIYLTGPDLHGWMRLLAVFPDDTRALGQALAYVGVRQVERSRPPRPGDDL